LYLVKRLKLGKPVKALKLWCSRLLDHLGARESKDLALRLANLSNLANLANLSNLTSLANLPNLTNLSNLSNLSSSKLGAGGCA